MNKHKKYYSVTKRNQLKTQITKWIDFTTIMLRKKKKKPYANEQVLLHSLHIMFKNSVN